MAGSMSTFRLAAEETTDVNDESVTWAWMDAKLWFETEDIGSQAIVVEFELVHPLGSPVHEYE